MGGEEIEDDFDWEAIGRLADKIVEERQSLKSSRQSRAGIIESGGPGLEDDRRLGHEVQVIESCTSVKDDVGTSIVCGVCFTKNKGSDVRLCKVCKQPLLENRISESESNNLLNFLNESKSDKNQEIVDLCSENTVKKNENVYSLFKPPRQLQSEVRNRETIPLETNLEAPKPGYEIQWEHLDSWHYPKSDLYALREYQRSIVERALFSNTMVVLPTGLGKTFIAAVVMHNYLHWFKDCKIIFMAPTRPLVSQQVKACQNIVGIPSNKTAVMLGTVAPKRRKVLWMQKAVFFCTPQTLDKDIPKCPKMVWNKVSLIVVDEAHRATGNYAYTRCIKALSDINPCIRILALSATPGRDLKRIQEVIDNLRVSRLEIKFEDDPDVRPYTHYKSIQTCTVPIPYRISQLMHRLDGFIQPVLTRVIPYAPFLRSHANSVSHSQTVKAFTSFNMKQADLKAKRITDKNVVLIPYKEFVKASSDFALLINLTLMRKLLGTQGISLFLRALERCFKVVINLALSDLNPIVKTRDFETTSKAKKNLIMNPEFTSFLQDCKAVVKDKVSNLKVEKTIEVVHKHFEQYAKLKQRTSVIIFTQYRDTVQLLCKELQSHRETMLLVVSPFIGQSNSNSKSKKRKRNSFSTNIDLNVGLKGQTQKQQQSVVKKFRAGDIDILIATCIGEEGLDIGSVDLIVCFDCVASPVRMIQRAGRAGRKRSGKIVMLVTEVLEEGTLSFGKAKEKRLRNKLLSKSNGLRYFKDMSNWIYYVRKINGGFAPKMKFTTMEVKSILKCAKTRNTNHKMQDSGQRQRKLNFHLSKLRGVTSQSQLSDVSNDVHDGFQDVYSDHVSFHDSRDSSPPPVDLCSQLSTQNTPISTPVVRRRLKKLKFKRKEKRLCSENASFVDLIDISPSSKNTSSVLPQQFDLFEEEAEESGVSASECTQLSYEDLDQDLESLLDDRPLSQLTCSVSPDRLHDRPDTTSYHRNYMASFSQSPVLLTKARKLGLNIETIENELDALNCRRLR